MDFLVGSHGTYSSFGNSTTGSNISTGWVPSTGGVIGNSAPFWKYIKHTIMCHQQDKCIPRSNWIYHSEADVVLGSRPTGDVGCKPNLIARLLVLSAMAAVTLPVKKYPHPFVVIKSLYYIVTGSQVCDQLSHNMKAYDHWRQSSLSPPNPNYNAPTITQPCQTTTMKKL